MAITHEKFSSDISALMLEVRNFLDGLRVIPRRDSATDSVLLGLLSKSVVLTEAIVCLVKNGFDDEAYGVCRSSIEVQLTVRYITNKDTISRGRRYFLYFTKDKSDWLRLIKKYYPALATKQYSDAAEIEKLSQAYKSPHRWSEAPNGVKDFASEPDTFNIHENGQPADELFYYEILYKWMSHYVHVTEPAIEPEHMPLPGDEFVVHYGRGRSKHGKGAMRTSFLSVLLNMFRVFRYLNMDIPDSLKDRFDEVLKAEDERVANTK